MGVKTCLIESGLTPEFVLPRSIRQDNQKIADDYILIEPHHKVKNNTATPR